MSMDQTAPRPNPGWRPRIMGGTDVAAREGASPTVAILLSVYNGEAFLNQQLDSFLGQTHTDWVLYWRDDGSTDASRAIMQSFATHRGKGRCVAIPDDGARIGIAASYWRLLRQIPEHAAIAFADQDDVWLPQKLEWGLAALATQPDSPALYCARQYLTDADLHVVNRSPALHQPPSFLAALTQNVATGHTIMFNEHALGLMHDFPPPDGVLHDWWAYLLVAGAEGRVMFDPRCVAYYRQHRLNAIGARYSFARRALCALKRGPRTFMRLFDANVHGLLGAPVRLTAANREALGQIARAMQGGRLQRWQVLHSLPGFERQTFWETVVFRAWFLR